jgi:hypothetical protein
VRGVCIYAAVIYGPSHQGNWNLVTNHAPPLYLTG